jgi:hypothetical protein
MGRCQVIQFCIYLAVESSLGRNKGCYHSCHTRELQEAHFFEMEDRRGEILWPPAQHYGKELLMRIEDTISDVLISFIPQNFLRKKKKKKKK